jgi:hypothetical protein
MDFGFFTECWWFFTETFANCSKVVPYLRECSIPASAKTAGIRVEPSNPSLGMPFPPPPPPSSPALPSCSTPTTSTRS